MSDIPIPESLATRLKEIERRLSDMESGTRLRHSSQADGLLTITDKQNPPTDMVEFGKFAENPDQYGMRINNQGCVEVISFPSGQVILRIGKLDPTSSELGISLWTDAGQQILKITQAGHILPYNSMPMSGAFTMHENYNDGAFREEIARCDYYATSPNIAYDVSVWPNGSGTGQAYLVDRYWDNATSQWVNQDLLGWVMNPSQTGYIDHPVGVVGLVGGTAAIGTKRSLRFQTFHNYGSGGGVWARVNGPFQNVP